MTQALAEQAQFVRPVFNPVSIADVAPVEGMNTEHVLVLEKGAHSKGVSLPLDIISWANDMQQRQHEMQQRLSHVERQHEIATKCPICIEADKSWALPCGHQFCVACKDKVIARAGAENPPSLPICPICRAVFGADDGQSVHTDS